MNIYRYKQLHKNSSNKIINQHVIISWCTTITKLSCNKEVKHKYDSY